jgi:hypothetical protein
VTLARRCSYPPTRSSGRRWSRWRRLELLGEALELLGDALEPLELLGEALELLGEVLELPELLGEALELLGEALEEPVDPDAPLLAPEEPELCATATLASAKSAAAVAVLTTFNIGCSS